MTAAQPAGPAEPIEVRPATERDLEGIRALARRVLPPSYQATGLLDATELDNLIDGFWSPEYFSGALADGGILWVAVDRDSVVGVAEVARLGDNEAILWKLYVDSHLQGQGIGTRLLAAVRTQLWSGTRRWFTEYVTGNEPAAGFYAKHGFEFDRIEPDQRPHVEATYTWCVRDAGAAVVLA